MKHAGGGYGVSSGGLGTMHPRKGWSQTPRWHWRYWIGHRMRHETYTVASGASFAGRGWRYRTFGQHARMVLEERANGQDAKPATYRTTSANWIVGRTNFPEAP